MLNYLYVALALALAVYVATLPKDSTPAPSPVAESVEGQGPTALACAACVAGGVTLVFSGWGAVLAAAFTQGSALVVAGCVSACYDALK